MNWEKNKKKEPVDRANPSSRKTFHPVSQVIENYEKKEVKQSKEDPKLTFFKGPLLWHYEL